MRGDRELYRDKIEVSLDGKQVFYLFFGAAVVACLVFVLGVMVGRRLESRAHADAVKAMEVASSDPLAALDLLAAGDGADDLSFPRELGKDPEPEPEPEPAAEPAAETEPEQPAPEPAAPAVDDAASKKAEAEAAKKRAAEKVAAEKAAAAKRAAEAAAREARGNWTLQLSSFQDESEAQSFFAQLKSSGYSPFISRAEVPGKGTWFRVRVGRYDDYDAAVAAKKSFEEKQHIIAYVTRL